jgi:nucleoid-associated protein YgaU
MITQQALGDRATPAKIMASWRAIYNANKAVIGRDPNVLRAGQKLVIPALP